MSVQANQFFNPEEKSEIIKSIEQAELNTSGEIRIHIENKCSGNVLDRAAYVFDKLEIKKTALRNGVLFYLAIESRKFAIIGDSGINAVVPEDFWESTKDMMQQHFKNGEFALGITKGIEKAGKILKSHFPYQQDDKNELSDEISFGNN